MTVEKLPQTRSDSCGVRCAIFDIGLPRCTHMCQQLRWNYLDAEKGADSD